MKYKTLICTQTFPPKIGGMESVMYSLACRFEDKGYEVSVIADKPWISDRNFRFYSINTPRFLRSFTKRLFLTLKRLQPNIVVCDSWKSVKAIPKSPSSTLIVLAHGQEYLNPSQSKQKRIVKALDRADLIVASSQMTAQLVELIRPNSKVEVIFPTYMLDSHRNKEVVDKNKKATFDIVSICRIDKRKGLLESAKALFELQNAGYNFCWRIGGSGPDLKDLRHFVETSSLAQCTTILGRISENTKTELLTNADLFLMPSYQEGKSLEGFGISYIEAAKFGVPSVAGNVGGAPEAVIHGQTGWCIDGSKPEEIFAALKDALTNPSKLSEFGQSAQERFNTQLAGEISFAKLLKLSQLNVGG